FGQLLESVPGDVPGGAPLPGDRLLVQLGAVVGPHGAPVGHVVRAKARGLGGHLGAARRHAAVARPVLGDDAVLPDVDVPDREAVRRWDRARAPAVGVGVHPAEVELAGAHHRQAVQDPLERGSHGCLHVLSAQQEACHGRRPPVGPNGSAGWHALFGARVSRGAGRFRRMATSGRRPSHAPYERGAVSWRRAVARPCRERVTGGRMRLRTILCPIDFSDLSARETEVAVAMAREFGARLVLHHDCAAIAPGIARAWDWEATHQKTDGEAQAERRMQAALNALPRDVRAEGVVSAGPVAGTLLALAEQLAADLIVLGSHGWSTETHASVTERVIAEAPCPVLTFNEGAVSSGQFRLRAAA